ncbi:MULTISPECIES: hypothetical protein [Rhodococcus]|uniref:hypothetical protein n=1 Tax=Rhodococcus TaxID=1827 RepID=UPI00193BDA7F|nr:MULTISPECIES: hypothetical protein [Rhodococcus]QRI75037.1 hypothetical protein JQ505_21165 [Rhodococcus aetherivorans]QSE58446.1 hypothetical protein JYA75_22270 [Rhodococcus sp. PSBB066]QSE70233.1 hypothetical protein JYA91_05360 [Rhodococcus sp. PSBB049]
MLRKFVVTAVTAVTAALGVGSVGTAAADTAAPVLEPNWCKWERFTPECIALWLAGVATGSAESGSALS